MALRLSQTTPCLRAVSRATRRQSASVGTGTAQATNLPRGLKEAIEEEASLPTPDPSHDSQTSRLVSAHSQFMVPTYVRPTLMLQKGEGCYVYDVENRRYLDFTAGIAVNALGHCHPEVSKLLYQQGSTLMHASNLYYNSWTGALSQLLVEKTREAGGMHTASRAFICNSGSEANEAALKFARKVGKSTASEYGIAPNDKTEIVSFHKSFHGRTMGAISATPNPKYQTPFTPMVPGCKYSHLNDIAALDSLITEKTCGVIVEPIQGEGGVNTASAAFLTALAARCRAIGAVLIYDEIQCGLSRTGSLWAHCALPRDAHPDIVTTAKALGNGFPIGATIVNDAVSDRIATGDHGTTFGGNPLGCRVAHYVLSCLAQPELQAAVRRKERVFRAGFDRLRQRFPHQVLEARGRGLILGLQLKDDPTPVVTAARERGLLVITAGTNTLRFVPPLIISAEEIECGMAILEAAMEAVFAKQEPVRGTEGQQEMP